jgi:hypothetical protein
MTSRLLNPLFFPLLLLTLWLSACGPSEEQIQATSTQIVKNIFATLTASAPTLTLTPAPTSTPVFGAFVNVPILKVYFEPGFGYSPVGNLPAQEGLSVVGRDRYCNWLNIDKPLNGWVNAQLGRVILNFPCATFPHGYYRPENGAIFVDKREKIGIGILKVDNGFPKDAHVLITYQNMPIYSLYIHSQEQAVLEGVPDGEYNVYFSSGTDWDAVDYRFTSDAIYMKFEDIFSYVTQGNQSVKWTITMGSAEGGIAVTKPVSPGEFPSIGD